MPIYNPELGVFRGTQLIQKRGTIGGFKNVFVALQGFKNELIFPTFGAAIANPFRGAAKLFAGDLAEYRTDSNGKNPKYYILKTFKAVSASSTTINILRDGYKHKPFVGDSIMIAPDKIGGSGTAVRITAVTETSVTVSEVSYPVWQLTVSANSLASAISNGTILVESEAVANTDTSATKAMMVKNINSVVDSDYDMLENPSLTYGNTDPADTNFDDARYHVSFALGGLMYTEKMSPMPQCVLDLNRSNVNGWFKVDYYDMTSEATKDELAAQKALAGVTPTTSTEGYIGQVCVKDSTHAYLCTAIDTSGDTPSYTWKAITIS